MLLRTYHRIISLFADYSGYMSFDELQKNKVTTIQMREMEREGIIQRFARGWYWCGQCGLEKPGDYRFIEAAKVNPAAVFCLDTACYLCGIIPTEPEILQIATARTDRRKMDISFPIKRHYFSDMGTEYEIEKRETAFGTYRYFSLGRTLEDCRRLSDKVAPETWIFIEPYIRDEQSELGRYKAYRKALREILH